MQPFAELILQNRKTIELRKWKTKFRGEFLIHASKKESLEAMKKFGFSRELPTGQIVGKAFLEDIKEYKSVEEFNRDKDKHLASKEYGKFGFILKNPERIKPISIKGKLHFWDFDGKIEKAVFY